MLDLLEAHLAGLRMDSVAGSVPGGPVVPPDALQAEMQACGLTPAVVAETMGVAATTLEDWVSGRVAAPALALSTLRLVARLAHRNGTTAAFQQVPARREPVPRDSVRRHPVSQRHPFSQIEDL